MSEIPLYTITHHFRFPKALGGDRGRAELGMFVVLGDGNSVEVLGKNEFGRIMETPKSKDYVFTKVPNPEDYLDDEPEELELSEWLEFMESRELTIADVEAMKPGQQVKIVMLHRNLGDVVRNPYLHPYGEVFDPEVFFKDVTAIYTHEKDLHGTLCDDEGTHSFNFDLNFKGTFWYPLNDDGKLPVETGEFIVRNATADYRKYPKTTKVGMRGPMLFFSALSDAPGVFHEKIDYSKMFGKMCGKM